jgi:hypothetical protein
MIVAETFRKTKISVIFHNERKTTDHEAGERIMKGSKPDNDVTSARRLQEKIRAFPASPGVYLMKDNQGNVIYVGKA